jgi:uncharacterized protein (TIGR02271 family)
MPVEKPRDRIPVAEEQVRVDRETVETGRVRVRTAVEHEPVDIDVPVAAEELVVERVPAGRVVDAAAGPRVEGDTTIIPVYEERVVVQKELVLVEEVHVRRVSSEGRHRERVDRRIERLEVSREEPE